jgi:HSP20 family molecular chaperone IbpA
MFEKKKDKRCKNDSIHSNSLWKISKVSFFRTFPGELGSNRESGLFPVDVKEADDKFIISAMLPGLKRKTWRSKSPMRTYH